MSAPAASPTRLDAGTLPRPPGPANAAAAAGLVGAATADVTAISAFHTVHRVSTVDRSVIVKVPGGNGPAEGRTLAPEAFAYRLATWQPELAAVMPQVLLVDERRQVVVLADCDDARSGRELLALGELPDPRASAGLGRSLARLHLATDGVPTPFATPTGVLDLTREPPPEILLQRARGLARSLAGDPELRPALIRGRESWRDTCLVHGDVKWDNCLVEQRAGRSEVLLIDWELSGLGDPAWDVAAALAGSLALEVSAGRSGGDDRWALVSAYYAAGGPAQPDRVALLSPARLVHLALECAEVGADAEADALVASAREVARDLPQLEGTMVRWALSSRPGSSGS